MGNLKVCQKCLKPLNEDTQFYKKKDGTKTDLCKACLTMHIDNFNPETFLWILQEVDVPYVPEEWNILRDRAYAKDPNLTGMSVFGKYLSKMKLKQWKGYSWEDSEKLQAANAEKKKQAIAAREQHEAILKEQFERGEITEAQYKTIMDTAKQNEEYMATPVAAPSGANNPYTDGSPFMDDSALKNLGNDLTEEDKTYLLTKWGRFYHPWEWVELEEKYNEMMESFDIQDADTINTLILICKTNLKMNQALDSGDVEGYQKLSKVSNDLRKSAKFTAAQNKDQKGDFVDSVGELVAYCEKNGGAIPRYQITTPLDIIDKIISDLKNYTKELIYEDKSLAKQIEDYLKKIEISKQMKADQEEAKAAGQEVVEIEDNDFIDYQEHLQQQQEIDKQTLEEG